MGTFIYNIRLINKIEQNGGKNMAEIIEMGTVSSRGQICIPNDIREEMELNEGNKVLFLLQDGSLLVKKVTTQTFAQITKPLREAEKKIREDEVVDLVHKMRKAKK